MTDGADRARARAAAATGELEDRARVLADELRRGARSLGELQLLAYLSDPAACLALNQAPPELPPGDRDAAVLWLRGFAAWGDEVLGRAVVAWLWSSHLLERRANAQRDADFLQAVERWWDGPSSPAAASVGAAWSAGFSNAALYLHLSIRQILEGKQSALRHNLDQALIGEERSLPTPTLVATRLGPWSERSRGALKPVPGEGPLWRRAQDVGTSPERRALVRYLRAQEEGVELVDQERAPVLLDGVPTILFVSHAGHERVTGQVWGSPMLTIHLDRLAIPPGAATSPDAW